jgi:hypothetical protein
MIIIGAVNGYFLSRRRDFERETTDKTLVGWSVAGECCAETQAGGCDP